MAEERCGGLHLLFYWFVACAIFAVIIITTTTHPDKPPAEEYDTFSDLRLRCMTEKKSEREELVSAVKFLTRETVQRRIRQQQEAKGLGIAAIIFSAAILLLYNISPVSCSALDQRNLRLSNQRNLLLLERFRKVRDEAVEEVKAEMEVKTEAETELEVEVGAQEEKLDEFSLLVERFNKIRDEDDNTAKLENHHTPHHGHHHTPRHDDHHGPHHGHHDTPHHDNHHDGHPGHHPVLNIANSVVYINNSSSPPSPALTPRPEKGL